MPLDENNLLNRWRRNFLAGLAITLPGIISLALAVWIFRNVSNVTDILLFFLPKKLTHPPGDDTPTYWYWSALALLLAVFLICLIGQYGRYYFGRRAIKWTDQTLMRIPLLNKIYGAIKQVNESFSNNKSAFQHVVLAPFPNPNSRAIGFVTGEQNNLAGEKLIVVFIPTTPIPTSGFLLLYAERDLTRLDMPVADAIKFIISLGAISPESAGHNLSPLPPGSANRPPAP
jgi:uncharacterized membrane protein